MFDAQIVTFLVAITLLTIVPGSDTMLVIRSVLIRGQLAGFLTTLGICCGLFVHATLSALGLSVIVVRSAIAYEVLKGLGACYLIGLGLWTIVQALRQPPHPPVSAEQLPRVPRTRQRWWQAWSEGLLNNVLNPKPAIFYLAFLPQFIHPTDPVLLKSLLLAGVHFVIGVLWLTLLVLVLGRIGAWVTHPRVRQQLETITGVVLIGLGLRLALEPRA